MNRINVYFRSGGKLSQYKVEVTDHEEAILKVKEALVASGEGWTQPVLAVINGGKQ